MKAYKITNPLRFFGFFGLFLIFMFLAVRSCTNKGNKTEFVKADEIKKSAEASLKKGNSEELEEFIEDVKENIKKEEKPAEAVTKKVKEAVKKPVEIVKKAIPAPKKIVPKVKKPAPKAVAKSFSSIVKKGDGDQIDAFSKLQLRKDVKIINSGGKGAVTVYGSYFPGEAKTKGFVRAAKIKNELIRLGIKSSITVYILPESQANPSRFGRIKFGK